MCVANPDVMFFIPVSCSLSTDITSLISTGWMLIDALTASSLGNYTAWQFQIPAPIGLNLTNFCLGHIWYSGSSQLILIQMAIIKWVAVQLEVAYDSQATNRKLGGLLWEPTSPPSTLLLVTWKSYIYEWPLAFWNTQKHRHKEVDALTILFDWKVT